MSLKINLSIPTEHPNILSRYVEIANNIGIACTIAKGTYGWLLSIFTNGYYQFLFQ